MKKLFFIVMAIIFQSCYKEEVVFDPATYVNLELPSILKINDKECSYDCVDNTLRFSIENDVINSFSPLIQFQENSEVYFEGKLLKNKNINNLGQIEINKAYEIKIKSDNSIKKIPLTFTNLPIVQIISPNQIQDDPKTFAKVIVNYKETNRPAQTQFIGIEYRGGSSQKYPKKSFGFSLKGSRNLNDDLSSDFFEMDENNDWILDAMWVDKGKLRNKTSFELWKNMGGDKHYGISGELVELYLNNEHQGVYSFNENINKEHLKINNSDAVLYKATDWENGATGFESFSNNAPQIYCWDGWEQKYPDPDVEINWEPLSQLRKLIVKETDPIFTEEIGSWIDKDNLIDYYIFLNLVYAQDNRGKNTFLYKKNNGSKFFLIPWDVDGAWGLTWEGSSTSYSKIVSNNLFDRLLETDAEKFNSRLKQRWKNLRTTTFETEAIKNMFIKHFTEIEKSNVISIENEKWGNDIDVTAEQEYLIQWIDNRVIFLDNYFEEL